MKALALILVVAAVGCGTRKTQTRAEAPGEGKKPSGEPAPAVVIKQVQLAWSTEPASPARVDPPQTKVYLAVTDETGRQTSYPLGVFPGSCSDQGPAQAYRAATVMQCSWDGRGVQLHAV